MRSLPAVLIALLLGFCLAMACEAAGDLSRDLERLERLREAVDVQADRIEYDEAEHKIVARGAVRVALGNRSLFADEVSVDLDDETLVASGHVVLMEERNRLEGDRIETASAAMNELENPNPFVTDRCRHLKRWYEANAEIFK